LQKYNFFLFGLPLLQMIILTYLYLKSYEEVMKKHQIKVGIAQIAPVWLNKSATIKKVGSYIDKAAEQGCDLVSFGEALIPGYPFWIGLTDGARFNSQIQKDLYAHYLANAVDLESDDLDALREVCAGKKIAAVIGTIEKAPDRGGHSAYCTLVYIDKGGVVQNSHRKLVPTYEERLCWSPGDGHGLKVHPLGPFTLGALNCWENWMPLSRSALYGMGENLHVALWPGGYHNTYDLTQFIAKESRSYVISVSGLLKKIHITDDIPHADLIRHHSETMISNGGSCLAGPDGNWIIEPLVDEEGLLVAEIDYRKVLEERQNFDVAGHYSRPDVTRLVVNRDRQNLLDLEG
jgi:nitrilase